MTAELFEVPPDRMRTGNLDLAGLRLHESELKGNQEPKASNGLVIILWAERQRIGAASAPVVAVRNDRAGVHYDVYIPGVFARLPTEGASSSGNSSMQIRATGRSADEAAVLYIRAIRNPGLHVLENRASKDLPAHVDVIVDDKFYQRFSLPRRNVVESEPMMGDVRAVLRAIHSPVKVNPASPTVKTFGATKTEMTWRSRALRAARHVSAKFFPHNSRG